MHKCLGLTARSSQKAASGTANPAPLHPPLMDGNRSRSLGELDEFLAALDEAGVALDLGFAPGPVREQLHQDAETPDPYRQLVAEWKAGEDPARALDRVLQPAQEHKDYSRRMLSGLAYPAAVATLACVIAATMGFTLLPLFESTYEQMNEPVGPAVARLQVLRTLTPLWLVAVPAAIAYGVRWAQRSDDRRPPTPSRSTRLAEWALRRGSDEDRRVVAELEANRARQRVWRRTTYWPLAALVVVGGGATLLLGLALFEPILELLYRLAL